MGRYELTESEWKGIGPCLPNKPRGVPRVNDRRVLNSIFWVLRSGARWADLPERYGPPTTIYNRFNRWRKAGVWARLMDVVTKAQEEGMPPWGGGLSRGGGELGRSRHQRGRRIAGQVRSASSCGS